MSVGGSGELRNSGRIRLLLRPFLVIEISRAGVLFVVVVMTKC